MVKKYLFIFIIILFTSFKVSNASASSVSYAVINNTATSTVSMSIKTIVSKFNYDCEVVNYTCTLTSSTTAPMTLPALKEMTVEDILKKESDASTTPKTPYVAPILKPLVRGIFTLPPRAVSITTSPDKRKIAYYLTEQGTVKTYFSYNLLTDDGKHLEKFNIMKNWDLVTDNTILFGFTDDSNKLVYIDDHTGYQQLYMVDLTKDPKNLIGEQLVTKKYTVFDFIVKGNYVYFIANRSGYYVWGLFAMDLDTKKLTEIAPSVTYTNNLVTVGDSVIYTFEEDGKSVLGAYDTKTNTNHKFTGVLEDSVPVLPYTILKNKNINGILIAPPKTVKKSDTAIIWLHGGPYRQSSPQRHSYGSYATYDWMLDEMIKQGTTVLKLDYPGSLGFGRAFSESLVENIGLKDVAYTKKAITYLKNSGIKKIYLFGNSYGGYLAIKGLVENDKALAGAISVVPVTDWQKLIKDVSPTPFEAHFDGTLNSKNKKLYDNASIIKNLGKLTKPLIIFHSELDREVPISQSEYIFKAMAAQNKDVKYYTLLGQGHVISGVTQNQELCKKLGEFIGVIATSTDYCVMK